jgi:hypothetical protein
MDYFGKFSNKSGLSKMTLDHDDIWKRRNINFEVVLLADFHFHFVHFIIQSIKSDRVSDATHKHISYPLLLSILNSSPPPFLKLNDFENIRLLFEFLKIVNLISKFIVKIYYVYFLFLLNSVSICNSSVYFPLVILNISNHFLFMIRYVPTVSFIIGNFLLFLIQFLNLVLQFVHMDSKFLIFNF